MNGFRPQRENRQHIADGLPQSDKQGPGDNRVADIQCFQVRQGQDAGRVPIIQAVTGINPEAKFVSQRCRCRQFFDLRRPVSVGLVVGVAAGMEFNKLSANSRRSADLLGIGINKEADRNPGAPEAGNRGRQCGVAGADDIQPAFCGQLLPFFRDEADFFGLQFFSKRDNGWRVGQFEIELGADGLPEQPHIQIINVPAILTEMNGDAVGARQFDLVGSPNGIGFRHHSGRALIARLPQCRNVINVNTESNHSL